MTDAGSTVTEGKATLHLADCLSAMTEMPSDSVHAVVTDPPYGLGFMGKHWDHGVPGAAFWSQALRVAKPGAHLLAFGGTRTFHRLTCAIEDAGFEIRDCVMWVYGSGFPKSLDVSKAIDKAAGAEREILRARTYTLSNSGGYSGGLNANKKRSESCEISAPATDAAREWEGWGTALKPAWEPIIVARKPLSGTVAANVLQHGTGALNIDGCRVGTSKRVPGSISLTDGQVYGKYGTETGNESGHNPNVGRWPANLVHDGSAEVLAGFPDADGAVSNGRKNDTGCFAVGTGPQVRGFADRGSAARFFYCAKASASDRNGLTEEFLNKHPTVKPVALMRYLCRLITPSNGVVLDPFAGSGSTGVAALAEGFRFIGIEKDADSFDTARERLRNAQRQESLFPMFAGEAEA